MENKNRGGIILHGNDIKENLETFPKCLGGIYE